MRRFGVLLASAALGAALAASGPALAFGGSHMGGGFGGGGFNRGFGINRSFAGVNRGFTGRSMAIGGFNRGFGFNRGMFAGRSVAATGSKFSGTGFFELRFNGIGDWEHGKRSDHNPSKPSAASFLCERAGRPSR